MMHLCIAGSIWAMPEKEKPPVMTVVSKRGAIDSKKKNC
jgi:hypothetical protein